jgi:beta-phosphoglucomutase
LPYRSTVTAVVFDFDGVLVDTERLHFAAFQDVFATRGWQFDARDYAERYLGYDDRDLLRAFARDRGLTLGDGEAEALIARKGEAYHARLSPAGVLYPGAAACVARLAAAGHPLAVASGSLHHEIVEVLGAADLLSPFAAIVGADDVARSKPAPDTYLKAADLLGIAPAMAVAIEDSTWGLDAAATAGYRTVAITTTSPAHQLIGRADYVIVDLAEFTPELVARLAALAGRRGA